MPVNYQQIRQAIKQAGQLASLREHKSRELRGRVFQCLEAVGSDPAALSELVQIALEHAPDLRCALPGSLPLNASLPETGSQPDVTLWAADGSQIIPDPHLAVQFGIINVGLICLAGGKPPQQAIESQLLYADDLYNNQGHLIGEELIALRRDYQERAALLTAVQAETSPILTLTDGPLELFREPKESREYQEKIADYVQILGGMAERQILTAGYVDRPRSDLVVRLLELTLLSGEQLSQAGQIRPFLSVGDAELFSHILKPGERSDAFGLQSRSRKWFNGQLALHFFYLNVGRAGKPQIARVEIPAWVVKSNAALDIIQHSLLEQCRQMGSKAYPYILHRAHETAMVTYEERDRLLAMIQNEILNQGQTVGEASNKQQAKNLAGKSRYGQ
jgi:hypothetical protein